MWFEQTLTGVYLSHLPKGGVPQRKCSGNMHIYPKFLLLLTAVAAACNSAVALTVNVRSPGSVVRAVESAKFDFNDAVTDVMAPHDVELVRRVGWTYSDTSRPP